MGLQMIPSPLRMTSSPEKEERACTLKLEDVPRLDNNLVGPRILKKPEYPADQNAKDASFWGKDTKKWSSRVAGTTPRLANSTLDAKRASVGQRSMSPTNENNKDKDCIRTALSTGRLDAISIAQATGRTSAIFQRRRGVVSIDPRLMTPSSRDVVILKRDFEAPEAVEDQEFLLEEFDGGSDNPGYVGPVPRTHEDVAAAELAFIGNAQSGSLPMSKSNVRLEQGNTSPIVEEVPPETTTGAHATVTKKRARRAYEELNVRGDDDSTKLVSKPPDKRTKNSTRRTPHRGPPKGFFPPSVQSPASFAPGPSYFHQQKIETEIKTVVESGGTLQAQRCQESMMQPKQLTVL